MRKPFSIPLNQTAFAAGLILLAFGLVAWIVLSPAAVHGLYNSDILLPAALHDNAFTRPNGYMGFQQARILSFFPDQAVYHPMALLTGDPRAAFFGYAVISFLALTWVGATAIHQLDPNIRVPTAALAFALVFTLLTFGLKQVPGLSPPYDALLFPVNHSGPLIVSIWLFTRLKAPLKPQMLLLSAIIFLTSLSDALFLLFAVAPLGLAALTRLDFVSPRALLRSLWREKTYAGLMAFGLCGVGASSLFFSQGAPPLTVQAVVDALRLLRHDLLSLNPFNLYYLIGLVVLVGVVTEVVKRSGDARRQMIYVAAAMSLPIGFFVVYYGGQGASRYLMALFVWPLILLSGALARHLRKGRRVILAGSLVGLAAGTAAHGSAIPALNWRDPVETCLSRYPSLTRGLAAFWVARPISVSSDFRLRTEQISPDGQPYVWGNDPWWYWHGADGTPARFDFIVMKDLDEAAIRAKYGDPARVIQCPTTAVWMYDDPARVAETLVRDATRLKRQIRL
ncbi:hypothetical protein PQU92_03205 [Asticcacaulis sp. BYS171W]|uniref:Glycosyltransferase RgtA/B/C/D-like domain-containing protein n=1 Tax=Asticcacaulis aquaticus TaxID=2984212 RepID=A0ABT5HS20_9CAUL|nr:hypothetical protein [Asticcacaulis aquaticus]MDC7682266.1 hypothetical protein [Asticcacaulis aquaticus]